MQQAIFPTKYINITQKWGGGTHKYGFPIDLAGKDTGIDDFYAPFDGVIKKIWQNGNTVWLESLNKVLYADGSQDYATISLTHDNNISDLRVGQVIKQGQVFYQEGTAGQATGNHVHFETARGKFSGTGWSQKDNGQWVINDPIDPTALLVQKDNIIVQTLGLNFKGGDMTEADANSLFLAIYNRNPQKDEAKQWIGWTGKKVGDSVVKQPEWLNQNHIILKAYPESQSEIKKLQARIKELEAQSSGEYVKVSDLYVKRAK